MDFSLSPEHQMTQKMVRDFAQKEIAPVIKEYDRKQEPIPFALKRMGELGILGIGHPEHLGGTAEHDVFMKVAVSEELMRSTSGGLVASLGSLDIGLPPVWRGASPEVQQRVVPAPARQRCRECAGCRTAHRAARAPSTRWR